MNIHFGKSCARTIAPMVLLACILNSTTLQADDFTQWTYSGTIRLNTKPSGADVTGNVRKFPVLIRLNTTNFNGFANTLPGGADIRFSKTDGTHIPYQIERWVDGASNNDAADIWVLVDTVYAADSLQAIKMYWGGKVGTADSSKGSAVFDTANGYQAVWHLGEVGNGNTSDATINNYTGTASGVAPVDTIGIIGRARKFNGYPSYFNVLKSASGKLNFSPGGPFTISTWVNADSVSGVSI
jgi:hypothetical protein